MSHRPERTTSTRPVGTIREARHEATAFPTVSVVVPTYRRPELLQRCLQALCAQRYAPADYEVIVVDNAGCEETRRVVQRAANGEHAPTVRGGLPWQQHDPSRKGPAIRYLLEADARGPAAARNRGWRAARGEVIAFTDDDCIPQPEWLSAGMAALANGELGVMGKTVVPLPPQPTDYEYTVAQLANSHFITANCFYRRHALEAARGFDERFTAAWREDSDLFFSLLSNGHAKSDHPLLTYAPAAVVHHPPRHARWGASLTQQRKSMFNALLFKKHPDKYRTLIQPSPPWRYYRAIVALLVALLALLRGRKRPAAFFLALWTLITCRFAAERLRHTSRAPSHVLEMLVTSALIPPLSVFWRLVGALKFRVFFM